MLDERKLAVLRAIVEDYVSTTEPVGSKSLVDRHGLDVSPATIRNDMAVLEEQGFIAQPHTSAGRIPTEKGYRLFVDRLSSVKPMSAAERRAIEAFLAGRLQPGRDRDPDGAAARPADQAGGGRSVPVAVPVGGPAHRVGLAHPAAGAARAHHRHRPGGAGRGGPARPGGARVDRRICALCSTRAWMAISLPTRPLTVSGLADRIPVDRAAERGGRLLRSARQPRRAARGARGFRRYRQPGRPRFRQGTP